MTFVTGHVTTENNTSGNFPVAETTSAKIEVSSYFYWKGIIGSIATAILLIPGIPIMMALIVLVRLTSRGPGIYRQERVGRHGRTFNMYKIRTMRQDAESRGGPEWTQQGDPRITRVGHVLRKLHLDEFPQLFNVLRGEMNLLGPRPERPEFTQVLAREIPGYLNRLAVAPGISGLAQINLPPDTDLDSVRRKLVLDLEYVQHASLLLDLRMFVATLLRLAGLQGEHSMRIMGLQRNISLPLPSGDQWDEDLQAGGMRTPTTIVTRHQEESSLRNGHIHNGRNQNGSGARSDRLEIQ